jgi:hypothetical protein
MKLIKKVNGGFFINQKTLIKNCENNQLNGFSLIYKKTV